MVRILELIVDGSVHEMKAIDHVEEMIFHKSSQHRDQDKIFATVGGLELQTCSERGQEQEHKRGEQVGLVTQRQYKKEDLKPPVRLRNTYHRMTYFKTIMTDSHMELTETGISVV